MLIKVSDKLYIGDNAIVSAEEGIGGNYKIELVNGNNLMIDRETLTKFLKHPGRKAKEEGDNASSK